MNKYTVNDAGTIERSQFLVFLTIVVLIAVAGYGYFSHVKRIITEEKKHELATIAELKLAQIVLWRKERLGDGATIRSNTMLAVRLANYLNGTAPRAVLEEFRVWMESLRKSYGYQSAALYNTDGTLLSSAIDASGKLEFISRNIIEQTVRKPDVYFSDFHRDGNSGAIHLDLMVPVGYAVGKNFQTVAVLVLNIDPQQFLYPLLKSWPLASKTAETQLVERNGNQVLFLNNVRHLTEATALTMRTPLADKKLSAVRAALGQEGIFEGKDYRGADVLAATRIIPDSPWAIVTKVDLSEIYEPIKTRAYWVMLLSLILILAAGQLIHLIWYKKKEQYKQQQLEEHNLLLETKIEERIEDLKRESNNLRGILDAMNNCVYIVNRQFKIEYANPAMLKEFGMIDGRTCYEYIHALQSICPWCKNQEVFSGQSVQREWSSKVTGKTYSSYDSPYKTSDGELWKLAILHDITDLKNLENDLRQQIYFITTLLDAIPNPVFFKDVDGRYLGINKAYEVFRGITKKEIIGKCVFDIAMPEDAEVLHAMDLMLTGSCKPQQYETTLTLSDGSQREVIYHKACFHDIAGKHAGMIGVIQDITELKKAENIIYNNSQELEQQVITRTKALVDANFELALTNAELEIRRGEAEITNKKLLQLTTAADAANRLKSQFLANMSHEIRTPLNAIIGFSALTLKTSLSPDQKDYIGKIHTAGELLLNIINDILDFSKIEAGQLHIEQIPFRLKITIANATGMLRQKALDKGLKLLVGTVPEACACLIGDPHRLSQILVNLLSNAVKFTRLGEVSLETALLKQENNCVLIKFTVHDTGIGIQEEQINRLFSPFTQADGSTTRRFGGTGLGLSISKQLVELIGGNICCESTPGQGSSFHFSAWFGISQIGDIEEDAVCDTLNTGDMSPYLDFSGSSILLVEDNEINQQLAVELLKQTGAMIHLAANGMEAVTMITSGNTQYNLVLMDIQMPVMDGYEATRLIRADGRFNNLPIIAMTAHAMQEEQKKIVQAGMEAYITKPIDAKTMLRVIRSFLCHQESESNAHLTESHANISCDEPVIPDVEGLNVSEALNHLDGDKNLYLWVLRSFLENQSNTTTIIEEALSLGDTKQAARHVHTIKGISGSIGAVELEKLALALENAIILDGQQTIISETLASFTSEFDRLLAALTSQLPATPQACDITLSDSVETAVLTPIFNRLLGYIKTRDGKAERYLDNYRSEIAGLPYKEIEQIKMHLKNFNFVAAYDALLSLSANNGIILTSGETLPP